MLKHTLILLLLLWRLANLSSQHCPFDGKSIVLVKVEGNRKNISNLRLEETNNPKADSCKYAVGLISLRFVPIDSIYEDNDWIKSYEKRSKKTKLTRKGDYFVTFGMASSSCMLPRGNNYIYQPRTFLLKYEHKRDGRTYIIPLDNNMIFSMCTGAGSWQRFKAVKIKLSITD